MDRLRRVEDAVETLLHLCRHLGRAIGGAADADRHRSQTPGGRGVRQQVVRQHPVQVEDRTAIECNVVDALDEELDGMFVVEDHLRLEDVPAGLGLSEFDQALGVEQGVGIAFQAARVPGKVDQHPVKNPTGMGAGRMRRIAQLPETA